MITGQMVYEAGFPGRESDWPRLVESRKRFWNKLAERLNKKVASPLLAGPETVALIQRRLDNIERAPGTWGSAESLEMQAHLFIETRQAIVRPKAHAKNPFETRDAYIRFMCAVNGEPTNTFLYCLLREEGRITELPKLICDYGRWVAREYPPETL